MEKITDLLAKLAEKLGTTIEHIWRVLINQAPIQVGKNVITIIILIIVNTLAMKYALGLFKGRSLGDDDDAYQIFVMIFAVILLVSSSIFGMHLFLESFDALLNPEYWALNRILELVKQ
jgi:hypothetical protein